MQHYKIIDRKLNKIVKYLLKIPLKCLFCYMVIFLGFIFCLYILLINIYNLYNNYIHLSKIFKKKYQNKTILLWKEKKDLRPLTYFIG